MAEIKLYQGDCLEIMKEIPDNSIDLLLTDPPYSSGGMYRSDRAKATSAKYQRTDTNDKKPDFTGDNRDQHSFVLWETFWISAALQKMKPGAVACIFTDWRQLAATVDAVQCGGLILRGVFTWIKPNARPQKGRFTQNTEFVVWASKGHMLSEGDTHPGYFIGMPPATAKRFHATEKPVALLEHLISVCPEDGTVLDCFMGSGSTGVACLNTNRDFIGIELDGTYFKIAENRIKNAQAE